MVEVTNISKMWLCIVEEANMLLTGSYKPLSFCIMFFFYRKQFSFTISLPSFFIFLFALFSLLHGVVLDYFHGFVISLFIH